MGSTIGHRIDYNGVGALRGQWHIPSKNYPTYPPPPPPGLLYKFEYEGKTKEGDHLIGGHLVEVQPYEDLRDGCMHLQIHYDHLAGI